MLPSFADGHSAYTWFFNVYPKRNDIVVAKLSEHYLFEYIVKRVAAIPGDKLNYIDEVLLVNDSPYIIDGKELKLSLEQWHIITAGHKNERNETIVKFDTYLLIGDNFSDSVDSRNYGMFDIKKIQAILL